MTLQRRISFALSLLLTLFIAIQGVLAYLSLYGQEDELVDDIVMSETERLVQRLTRGELQASTLDPVSDLNPHLSAWVLAARSDDRHLPAHLRGLSLGSRIRQVDGRELHIVVADVAGDRLIVQFDATKQEDFVRRFGLTLLLVGTLCAVFGAALSVYIARVVVGPLRRLTERFSSWAPGTPIAGSAVSDEERRLLEAFNRVRARLEESIVKEREFAENVGHEIRTPLTAIRTDVELLQLSETLNAEERNRLERIAQRIDDMAGTLQALSSLFRRRPSEAETVDLARCADDAWDSLAIEAGRIIFDNRLARGDIAVLDRHALMTILRNLFRNASAHAAASRCTVSRTPTGLEVRDDGRGIPEQELPFVFDRHFRGRLVDSPMSPPAAGEGLGLAIAKKTAELHGWALDAVSAPGRGTCFRLDLGAVQRNFDVSSTLS